MTDVVCADNDTDCNDLALECIIFFNCQEDDAECSTLYTDCYSAVPAENCTDGDTACEDLAETCAEVAYCDAVTSQNCTIEIPCETDEFGYCIYDGSFDDAYFYEEYQFNTTVEGDYDFVIDYDNEDYEERYTDMVYYELNQTTVNFTGIDVTHYTNVTYTAAEEALWIDRDSDGCVTLAEWMQFKTDLAAWEFLLASGATDLVTADVPAAAGLKDNKFF